LSVAQYLPHGALTFDLIIMDEASQLRPEDALGAIARGSQLVVVGDPKQLPPTSFFDSLDDDGDGADDTNIPITEGVESILDMCQQTFSPARSLRWHYRSQHESLIAYSNHYFYPTLVIFPSPHLENPRLGVKWRFVRDGLYEERRNFPEAKRVADAVIWHMATYPDESLGVVTLNGTQRDLIEELLDRRFRESEACQKYLERWEAEDWPFFVKNLENVQGDERDAIMISTTFGKPKGANKVRQNFWPNQYPARWMASPERSLHARKAAYRPFYLDAA
jgi:superfamily I DNA and/or RNA helicase